MSNNPIWVLTDGIFVGLAFALTIFVFGAVETGPLADDLYLRAFFGFVLGVCSKPALDGALIELASDTPPRFGRYHYGRAMGCMWGLLMILAYWPLSPMQVVIWIGAGFFFGVFTALLYKPTEASPARLALYDVRKHNYDGWHPLWRIGPDLFLLCIIGVVLFAAEDDSAKSPYLMLGIAAALINNTAPYNYRYLVLKTLHFFVGVFAIIAGYLSL
jgi:hypothetical protein